MSECASQTGLQSQDDAAMTCDLPALWYHGVCANLATATLGPPCGYTVKLAVEQIRHGDVQQVMQVHAATC